MTNRSHNLLIYCQSLENDGTSTYIRAELATKNWGSIESASDLAQQMRELMDRLSERGFELYDQGFTLSCKFDLTGCALLTLRPSNQDKSGRTSPVQVIFGLFDRNRDRLRDAVITTVTAIGRVLSQRDLENLDRLHATLAGSRLRTAAKAMISVAIGMFRRLS